MFEDTIAAIATPPGIGSIAVVRVSGPLAEAIFHRLFRPHRPVRHLESHRLYYGDIVSPETGMALDEALVSLMRKPYSYTGEDVLEIQGHGGFLLPQQILSAVIRAGARPAEPGEFTRRAFLNGRINLAQAEAVAEMITAQTGEAAGIALSQLKGGLGHHLDGLVEDLRDILAHIEADIDFSEDVEETSPGETIARRIEAIAGKLKGLASTYDRGVIFRNGVSVVIAGRPNVGKSSLLNRLLGEKRAIVTSTPGTTRDFIEESIDLKGIAVRMTDTAGIRPTENDIERAGIDLVWERIADADAVIVLMDGSEPLNEEDRSVLDRCRAKPIIPVLNKSDLQHVVTEEAVMAATNRQLVRISAKYDMGIDALKTALYGHFMDLGERSAVPHVTITNLRHKLALEKAVSFLKQGAEKATGGLSPELAAADIRDALASLEEICGKTVNDDVLDRIFSKFCIGK